jgi:hypothetical protein
MKLLLRIYVNILQPQSTAVLKTVYTFTRTHALTHRVSCYMHAASLSRSVLKRLLL